MRIKIVLVTATHVGNKFDSLVLRVQIIVSFVSKGKVSNIFVNEVKVGLPRFIFESHAFRNKAHVKDISRAFQFCTFQFIVDVRCCIDSVACYNCIVIPDIF